MLSDEEFRGALRMNVLKYIWRYRDKGDPVGDLHKCRNYLNMLIQFETKRAGK